MSNDKSWIGEGKMEANNHPGPKVCTANWEQENQSSQMKGQERGVKFTGACVQSINNRQADNECTGRLHPRTSSFCESGCMQMEALSCKCSVCAPEETNHSTPSRPLRCGSPWRTGQLGAATGDCQTRPAIGA